MNSEQPELMLRNSPSRVRHARTCAGPSLEPASRTVLRPSAAPGPSEPADVNKRQGLQTRAPSLAVRQDPGKRGCRQESPETQTYVPECPVVSSPCHSSVTHVPLDGPALSRKSPVLQLTLFTIIRKTLGQLDGSGG